MALQAMSRRKRVAPEVEEAGVALAIDQLAWGQASGHACLTRC
jgi:hypothetical protein